MAHRLWRLRPFSGELVRGDGQDGAASWWMAPDMAAKEMPRVEDEGMCPNVSLCPPARLREWQASRLSWGAGRAGIERRKLGVRVCFLTVRRETKRIRRRRTDRGCRGRRLRGPWRRPVTGELEGPHGWCIAGTDRVSGGASINHLQGRRVDASLARCAGGGAGAGEDRDACDARGSNPTMSVW
jgi:hypothetical protein